MSAPSGAEHPFLVVDDDDDTREGLTEMLTNAGYPVVEAGNGKEALEYLTDRRNALPCLIILDLSMPVMTGWEFLAIAKGYVRLARIPVILLSGLDPQLDPLKHGTIAGYLKKPYRRTICSSSSEGSRQRRAHPASHREGKYRSEPGLSLREQPLRPAQEAPPWRGR